MISLALFEWASHMDRAAVAVTRLALIVVLLWIGGLKAAKYEADSIVPFVANSPLMRFFYADRRHLLAAHPWLPQVATVGSAMIALMSLTTLSFLVTTPEAWLPAVGDTTHGFPFLAGPGRLVLKDTIMLGAALMTMADSAKAYLAM